jgi:N-formylmaleamate deformylase
MTIHISGRSVFVAANGLRHHLLVYDGTGLGNIIIIPGVTSPAATADFIARPLSALGYTVYVPDLRGRGASDIAPAGCYNLTDYAADLNGIIKQLDLGGSILMGHSLGARIAAAYVVRYSTASHGQLILVDPPTSGPGRGPYPTSRESFAAQLAEAKKGTGIDEVRRFYPKWPDRELQLRSEVLASCDETAVLESHTGFETEDFFDDWVRIKRPAILLRGSESPVVPAKAAADLAASNPSISIVGIPDAGHMIPWDNFSGFMNVLVSLLPNAAAH